MTRHKPSKKTSEIHKKALHGHQWTPAYINNRDKLRRNGLQTQDVQVYGDFDVRMPESEKTVGTTVASLETMDPAKVAEIAARYGCVVKESKCANKDAEILSVGTGKHSLPPDTEPK